MHQVETNLKRLSVHMLVLRVAQSHADCEDIYNSVELLERYSTQNKSDVRIHNIKNVHKAIQLIFSDINTV